MSDIKPLDGWTHPDHLEGVHVITWIASGPDTLNDGAKVVQIDTEESTGRVRVNLNDGVIYDGNPEINGHAVQALIDISRAVPDSLDTSWAALHNALYEIRRVLAEVKYGVTRGETSVKR